MFTQKSPSRFKKLGDAATFFLLAALFVGGGLLLSRHVSLAVPLLVIFVALVLPMFAMRLLMLRTARAQQKPQPIPVEVPLVEWKQIVGKDGEVVEVGYLKKRRDIG